MPTRSSSADLPETFQPGVLFEGLEARAGKPCVVVGAGPVGLTAALALRRLGLAVTVLEAEAQGRVRPGSRAIAFAAATLRRYEKVSPGLGKSIDSAGIHNSGAEIFYAGRRVMRFAPRPQSTPPFANLPQTAVEEILLAEAIAAGVRFRWGTPVTGVATDADSVTVTLDSGEQITTPYLIGADGARSVVRKAIGATMQGSTDQTPFIIVDAAWHPDGSTPNLPVRFHYSSPELSGRNILAMPFAGGLRLDLQCLPSDDAEYLASPHGLRQWIKNAVDPWYAEHITWVSTYRFHQLVASTYTDPHRRVLLAGEAAHLFAPWGGRGLNSGVMDATDAAFAIATALAGDPAEAGVTIDQCATERRSWGLHNRKITSRSLRIMRGTDPITGIQRAVAAKLAPIFPPAGLWLTSATANPAIPHRHNGAWNVY